MNRADRITDRALNMSPRLFTGFNRGLHIPRIIQSVKDPEDCNPVLFCFETEGPHHIVGIVAVTKQILSP